MKSLASAKDARKESKQKISHRELSLAHRSLWFIIFIGLIFLDPSGLRRTGLAQGVAKRVTLDNGMVVLLKENHHLPLCCLFLCVRTGSAQEGKFSGSGISHFTEHMLFKGTKTRKVGDIFREIESYGGKINGFTSYDYTGYKITVPSEFAFAALNLLADMVKNAALDQQELQKERQVVLKEIRLNHDSPQRHSLRVLWKLAFSVHAYQYPILGQKELFEQLSREDLLQFYQAEYTPDNMALAVVGDIQSEDFLSLAKGLFKDFTSKKPLDGSSKPEPKQKQLRKVEEEFSAGLTYLLLGFHSVSLTDEDLFALDVLATILGQGESSRLYKTICDKKRSVYKVEAINYTPKEPGLFIISSLLEEKFRKRALSLILKQIERVKKKRVSEEELETAKNKITSDIIFANQTIEGQAQDLALNEALTGDYQFTEKYIKKIKQVDAEDLIKAANKYLNKDNLNIVALIPQDNPKGVKSKEVLSQPLSIGIENLSRDADYAAGGDIQKYVLDNGVTVLVGENRDLPIISLTAVFKGGLRAEDEHLNGLSNLVAQMLDKGTKTRKADQIADLIESKGAHLSYFSGNNSFGLTLEMLSRDFEQLFAAFSDLIINPKFAQSELNKQKAKNLAQIKTQEDNIFESGIKLLKSTLFEKHPYKFLTVGDKKSLKKIKRRDLIKFYQNFCVGKNMVLTVFGDVDKEDVLLKARRYLDELNPGQLPDINPAQEPKIQGLKLASKTLAKQQTLLLLGFHGTTVFGQDRYVLEIICQVLSQASGRFFTRIREEKGLAYTLGAYSVLGLDPGYLVLYAATTGENVELVKEEVLNQLHLIKQEGLSTQELEQAKRTLVGRKMISRQTNSSCALESSLDELYGLGHNNYLTYAEQINQVNGSDITRCAAQYFDLTNYALVVIGPQ